MSKSTYHVIGSLTIIFLFFFMFGILPFFIEQLNLKLIPVISFIIGGIGAVIIFISLFSPSIFTKQFMKKNSNVKSKYNQNVVSLEYGLVGILVLLGGYIYSFSGDPMYVIWLFVIPVTLRSIITMTMSRKQ